MIRKLATCIAALMVVMSLVPAAGAHTQKVNDPVGDTLYAPLDLVAGSFKETKKTFTFSLSTNSPVAAEWPEGNSYVALGWSFYYDFNDDVFYDVFLYPENGKWHVVATYYNWPEGAEMPDYAEVPAKLQNKSNKNFKVVIFRKNVPEAKKGDTVYWGGYSGYGQGDDSAAACYDEFLAPPTEEPVEESSLHRRFLQEEEEPVEEEPGQYGCWDVLPDDHSGEHKLKK